MIISFNGNEGSGKTTIAKKVAARLNYPEYSMGKIFRELAEKKGITLAELQKLCQKNPKTDKEVDQYLVSLAEKEKDLVIESRTAWHFIPKSLKIYLIVDKDEGAKRIFKELTSNPSRNREDGNIDSIEKVKKIEKERRERDDQRYKNYYGINIHDLKNYDFILDTTNFSIEEVLGKVMDFINSKMNAQSH